MPCLMCMHVINYAYTYLNVSIFLQPADKGLSQLANLSVDFQNVWSCFSLSIEQELMMNNGNSLGELCTLALNL